MKFQIVFPCGMKATSTGRNSHFRVFSENKICFRIRTLIVYRIELSRPRRAFLDNQISVKGGKSLRRSSLNYEDLEKYD